VDSAEKELSAKTSQVEKRAMGRAARLSEAIEETQAQQQARFNEVGGSIQELRSTTQQTGNRLGSLTGKVGTVEEKVDETRQELERTIADLKTVRGDLGVQSGLIATNADELTALRELGERNYFEFDITKAKQASRVGPVTIRLRRADTKRNRFNIDLWADDKRIEKKNKTLLEPVQFYVIGSRQPCALVVNRISKDRIVGYLATPKVPQPRLSASNTSARSVNCAVARRATHRCGAAISTASTASVAAAPARRNPPARRRG